MNTKLIAAALIAASTAIAAPAFASSYGPAGPVGATTWQQSQSAQRVAAEHRSADRDANTAYGGSQGAASQSGAPSAVSQPVGEGH